MLGKLSVPGRPTSSYDSTARVDWLVVLDLTTL